MMPYMKLAGKIGLLISIMLSILAGLNNIYYAWLLPIVTFQTLSYYLLHFKNFKFKKISRRNNPFTKELPRHLVKQSFIVFVCFGIGLVVNSFFEHEAYALFLGQITQIFNAMNSEIEAVKQAMIELYNAILQSRFN